MNTDKICIFTDMGRDAYHQGVDIPLVRFRTRNSGDNLSNYDSTQEQILYVAPVGQVKLSSLLFVTKTSMCKLVVEASLMLPRERLLPQSWGRGCADLCRTCR